MLKLTGKFRQKVSVQTVQLYSLKHGLYRSAFILASRARNLRGAAKYGKQSLGLFFTLLGFLCSYRGIYSIFPSNQFPFNNPL